MNIIVPVKIVPDLVEELKIDDQGLSLDPDWLRLKLNEFDDHAIEQAILLKERSGGTVTVIAPDGDGADDLLYTAYARGADRLLKLTGDAVATLNNHALSRQLAHIVLGLQPGLILTGVQAHNDLDGALGPLLAGLLGFPYAGYISGVSLHEDQAAVRKEFPGGLVADLMVSLPAVLGIQAAEQPPRYVAFSRVRQAMKEAHIEEISLPESDGLGGLPVRRMLLPEKGQQAEILQGEPEQVAAQFVEVFSRLGVL